MPVPGLDAIHEKRKEIAVLDAEDTLAALKIIGASIDVTVNKLHERMRNTAKNQGYRAGMVDGLLLAKAIPDNIKAKYGGKIEAAAAILEAEEAEQAQIAALNDEP